MKFLDLAELYRLYEQLAQTEDVNLYWYPLLHRAGTYQFPKIVSKEIAARDRVLMIGAGIHGDEIAGPITLAVYGPQIVRYAREREVRVVLYPVRNPSGYGIKRYNVDCADDEVELGNNDFLRYVLADGRIVDDLKEGDRFAAWGWSSDPAFGVRLPAETQLMHNLLKQDPLELTGAVIDLHQDYVSPRAPPLAYHYAFGDLSVYRPIVSRIEQFLPLWRNELIGAGYAGKTDEGRMSRNVPGQARPSDENGFIVRHDGTWPDLMCRLGEAQGRRVHCITPETTGATPLDWACEVNRIWIYGIIDLISSHSESLR